jgi:hypothetical protein
MVGAEVVNKRAIKLKCSVTARQIDYPTKKNYPAPNRASFHRRNPYLSKTTLSQIERNRRFSA